MSEISFNILSKQEFVKKASYLKDQRLLKLLNALKEDLTFVYEKPYIDKVFRDSYYTYFASKHQPIARDCIRVSIFNGNFTELDFFSSEKKDSIQSAYHGFFVIRPTKGKILGRSMISPLAFREQNFLSCLVKARTQLFGIPLEVHAFPHSSQDSHTITCAETTIWAIMEYFGNRYIEYKPTLPSEISKVLSDSYTHRVYPSEGLSSIQISKALKEFDFGVVMYSRKNGNENQSDLFRSVATYVESGIPVILSIAIENEIGHAVVVCGHEELTYSSSAEIENDLDNSNSLSLEHCLIYDSASIPKKFLFIDDNQPQYQLEFLEKPFQNYTDEKFHSGYIKNLIVPLYSKIYLEERKAHLLFTKIITDKTYGIEKNFSPLPQKLVRREFLTSTKSYKKYIFENTTYSKENKKILLSLNLPKFVWICELSTFENYLIGKIDAQVILDATGNPDFSALILAQYPKISYLRVNDKDFKNIIADFIGVDIYRNNLKGQWNQWKA